ncbi:MAG: hypothetical protein LQ340_001573 [Diploschistes diacapsis]|nr:MAG: hypothetical protein LQ340_001573 [Diploschistes diacapsis]
MTSRNKHPEIIEIDDDSDEAAPARNSAPAVPRNAAVAGPPNLPLWLQGYHGRQGPAGDGLSFPEAINIPDFEQADPFGLPQAERGQADQYDRLDRALELIRQYDRQRVPNIRQDQATQARMGHQLRPLPAIPFANRLPNQFYGQNDIQPRNPLPPSAPRPAHMPGLNYDRSRSPSEDYGYFGGQLTPSDLDFDSPTLGTPVTPAKAPGPPPVEFEIVLQQVFEIFPDICPKHVKTVYDERVSSYAPADNLGEIVIMQIAENGEKYPRQKSTLKRKTGEEAERGDDIDELVEYASKSREAASHSEILDA